VIKLKERKSIMTTRRAELYNRKAASPASKPEQILGILDLQPGQKVADVGSGGGYYVLRFAQAVGNEGHVYAVDTNPEFLKYLSQAARERGLDNITTLSVTGGASGLPALSLDLVFMRNVHHHLPNRIEYFKKLREALRPDGKVAIIEHDGKGFLNFFRLFGRFTSQETIVEEMTAAGFQAIKRPDILSKQSFTIFGLGSE
jgi:ubiquinone/menaquinone biosynthesis C-methylase UbiE